MSLSFTQVNRAVRPADSKVAPVTSKVATSKVA